LYRGSRRGPTNGAFERRERLATSTATLDRLEESWWNEHAALIDRLWALPEDVRIPLRRDFARRARAFFGHGRILELACGTGWPGRMIAGKGIQIVGVDLSPEQIARARAEAANAGLAEHCEYHRGDVLKLGEDQFEGVLIHAGLHHLADDEAAVLLDGLARPGLKVLLYEPLYPRPAPLPAALRRLARAAVEVLVRAVMPRRGAFAYDEDTIQLLDEVVQESSRAGWFFSPKEAPFEESRLERLLRARFDIRRVYPSHFRSIDVAQRVGLIVDPKSRRRAVRRNLQPAIWLDRLLFATRTFRAFDAQYVFYSFELIGRRDERAA
jgi:SAM-dependent methyltransferase